MNTENKLVFFITRLIYTSYCCRLRESTKVQHARYRPICYWPACFGEDYCACSFPLKMKVYFNKKRTRIIVRR